MAAAGKRVAEVAGRAFPVAVGIAVVGADKVAEVASLVAVDTTCYSPFSAYITYEIDQM